MNEIKNKCVIHTWIHNLLGLNRNELVTNSSHPEKPTTPRNQKLAKKELIETLNKN